MIDFSYPVVIWSYFLHKAPGLPDSGKAGERNNGMCQVLLNKMASMAPHLYATRIYAAFRCTIKVKNAEIYCINLNLTLPRSTSPEASGRRSSR
jgi:hypothetical protein